MGDGSKTGKEAFLLLLHTFFLIVRTVLSVMVARLDGRIVRDLVSRLAVMKAPAQQAL